MPEVSVIIPTYNSSRYVTEAIESVLAQSIRDYEILVIDDGSTDDTEAVMSRFSAPVRYIRQENGGVSGARNKGIELSQGKYIAFLDADDTWFPEKLARQLDALRGRSDSRACFSAFIRVDHELNPLGVSRNERSEVSLDDLLTCGNAIGSICTIACERSLFEEVGGFDPDLSQCADWDMWVRIATRTKFLYVDEPLVTYRQHQANMSRSASLLERDSFRVLEKGFAMPAVPASLRSRRRSALARNNVVLAGCYLHAGRYRDVARCLGNAAVLDIRACGHAASFPWRFLGRALSGRRAEAS